MDKLTTALQRLFLLPGDAGAPDQTGAPLRLLGAAGEARTLVVHFARAQDWAHAAALYQAVQEELELPAPAVSVAGNGGYGVWFSLAAPVPLARAEAFLAGLGRKYLADLPPAALVVFPTADHANIPAVPSQNATSGKWSAFIDPSMGAMFADEPGLEMAPNRDRQADLLAGLKSIGAADFERVLETLASEPSPDAPPRDEAPASGQGDAGKPLTLGGNYTDPMAFLLAVMNDPAAGAEQRIAAAQALLPYFHAARHD